MTYRRDKYGGKYPIVYPGDTVLIDKFISAGYKDRIFKVIAIEDWKLSQPVIRAIGLNTKEEDTFGSGWIVDVLEYELSDISSIF